VVKGKRLGCQDSPAQEVKAGSSIHAALDEFETIDLAFDLTVAVGQREGRGHCGLVAAQTGSKSL
jgi:hypothetical protein